MLTFHKTFLAIALLILSSCGELPNRKPAIESALTAASKKVPQLSQGQTSQEAYFKLVRSVRVGDTGIELQLRSTPDSVANPQSVVLLMNAQKRVYGIPLLPNKHRDYWDFLLDTPLSTVPPTSTTFQKELDTSLQVLGLRDSVGTAWKIIDELFVSLLQCRRVYDNDSTSCQTIAMQADFDVPEEAQDSCQRRLKKGWQAIQKEMHPSEFMIIHNAYWDERNNRIYQLEIDRKKRAIKGLKVYRQECTFHPTSL